MILFNCSFVEKSKFLYLVKNLSHSKKNRIFNLQQFINSFQLPFFYFRKPMTFAERKTSNNDCFLFGLPGNPVSYMNHSGKK